MHPVSLLIPLNGTVEQELSWRAVITGVVLGILLTPSNVYAGLKIGWSFNMSIIALLIGYAIWQGLARRSPWHVPWTLHESNINQTVASAAASIISGGLVAPIPAYTLLTGHQLDAIPMIAWVFSVSFLGIWIAWYLRHSRLNDQSLRFPEGMATLETLLHTYNHGREAATRLKVLLSTALLSGLAKWVDTFMWAFPRWSPTPYLERLTAPAVATWKAVAQTLTHGLDSLSASIRWAIVIAGLAGLLLGVLDSTLPAHRARYLPSAAALGLAFVLPDSVSLIMALGALLTCLVSCRWPSLTERFAIITAAGLIAGESITGVGASLWQMLGNG